MALARPAWRIWALTLLLSIGASAVAAQTGGPPSDPVAPPPPTEVKGPEISMLVRTTIIALDQANTTGNYTVLRDLGASILKTSNTAADLAVLFAEFRKTKLNLAPTVLFDAVLDKKPALSTNGVLKLVGHFPTKPQEVMFDMTFSYELGAWRIALLSVGTRMAVADAGSPPVETEPADAKPAAADLIPPTKGTPPLPRARPKP